MYDLIVIGGGPAGVTAALRARELGASVALVERGYLGGICTNDGTVPTRVLAKAARLVRESEQFSDYGIESGNATVDFARLLGRARQVIEQVNTKKQILEHLERTGTTIFTQAGDTRFIDPHTIELADGTTLQAEKFIICAGGRARKPQFPGIEYALSHHDVWALTELPRSLVVVGGAATGCQMASIFAAFGTRTWLLDTAERLLSAEDDVVSNGVAQAFAQRGIEVITGIGGIDRIDRHENGLQLHYTHRNAPQSIQADAVLLAVGWVGNIDQLNLAAAGVLHDTRYIVVDGTLQTSAPHIFAAGDITGVMMLVQSGSMQGRVAAENAVLGLGRNTAHQIVPHGGFTDPEYASVGMTERQAALANDCVVAVVSYTDMDRAVIDDRPQGVCKLIVSRQSHQILGAHVVGEQAVEVVQIVAAAMAAGMRVERLAELELAYPTYTAIVGLTARQVVRELGMIPLAPSWRALGQLHIAEWERSAAPQ